MSDRNRQVKTKHDDIYTLQNQKKEPHRTHKGKVYTKTVEHHMPTSVALHVLGWETLSGPPSLELLSQVILISSCSSSLLFFFYSLSNVHFLADTSTQVLILPASYYDHVSAGTPFLFFKFSCFAGRIRAEQYLVHFSTVCLDGHKFWAWFY